MTSKFLIYAQLALAAVLCWTCLCRGVKTDENTHREVRWAIAFEGVAGGLVFLAPLLPLMMVPGGNRWSPSWPAWSTPWGVWLVLLLSVTLVQLVTAKYWTNGHAPAQFQRPPATHSPGALVFAALLMVVGLVGSQPPATAAPTRPQPQPEPEVTLGGPVFPYGYGDGVICANQTGCVSFTREALEEYTARAVQQACGAGRKPAL